MKRSILNGDGDDDDDYEKSPPSSPPLCKRWVAMVSLLVICLAMAAVVVTVVLLEITPSTDLPPEPKLQCPSTYAARIDCHPDLPANADNCRQRGCCWQPVDDKEPEPGIGIPFCSFPTNYPDYRVIEQRPMPYGRNLVLTRAKPTHLPKEIPQLQVEFTMFDENTLRIRVIDPANKRYEVPIDIPEPQSPKQVNYDFNYTTDPFSILVTRKSNGQVLFNTSVAPLLYADQLLHVSSRLPSKYIYGLGEQDAGLLLSTEWMRLTFWSRGLPPMPDTNLYGVHPFYLNMEPQGLSNGVFLLNSNAMEVILSPMPAITYRTIGGILDFFIFTGPTPADVVSQYLNVIGRPIMPPYWALGFHLCRWGYGGSAGLKKVIKRMRDGNFPYEAQWTDIDYMDRYLDWTYDKTNFSELPAIVDDLHQHNQYYVIIVDCGISDKQPNGTYLPYDTGMQRKVFIEDSATSTPIAGNVWPGTTFYPDFTNPATVEWWQQWATDFHQQVPFDGLWIDMNEPFNFGDGSLTGCENNTYNLPPYTPWVADRNLSSYTLCPSSKQFGGRHYDLHSLYGHTEAVATNMALKSITAKRPLVITRSTFVSTGAYAGHWLGDNYAEWKYLYPSIPGILTFNMFGIPLVGADICGFDGNTTAEMCTRWSQLGVFYPFMRNHNSVGDMDQDPASFQPATQDIIRTHLVMRYQLLPYLYTLFHHSNTRRETVVRPLFFEYPSDVNTYAVDRQLLFGPAMLVSPVLDQGVTSVSAYFPAGMWYDFYNGTAIVSTGVNRTLDAPLEKINVHLRAGYIVPTQEPAVNTHLSRQNAFGLLVALNDGATSSGGLFWDDGESFDTFLMGTYNYISFTANNTCIQSTVGRSGYAATMQLGSVTIYGLQSSSLSTFFVNGIPVPSVREGALYKLTQINGSLLTPNTVTWN